MINIVTSGCGVMGAIKYILYGYDRDIFMTSKPIEISLFMEYAYYPGTRMR